MESKIESTTQNVFPSSSGRKRILVVDDEENFRSLMEACLSGSYDVALADSASEAESFLHIRNFDIALIDVNMPGTGGKELFTKCSEAYPDMPIILMSGKPLFDDAVETVKQGAFDYLAKPFDMKTLSGKIEGAIKAAEEKSRRGEDARIMSPELLVRKKFRIISSLGAGNAGIVLLVEKDGGRFAMKILRFHGDASTRMNRARRFLREGKILMGMDHPNVIKVFKYGLLDDKEIPYMLMEYIEGENLADYQVRNIIPMPDKCRTLRDIASGLAHIHSNGIIHRDVKPQNIICCHGGLVKITDFGIAKDKNSMLTMTSDVMGTPSYMAPESFSSCKQIDHRADIFSLGSLSYEFLTGARPFEADTVFGVMEMVKNHHPPRPSSLRKEISPWMDELVMWMLEKEADARPGDCAEIVAFIERNMEKGR